MKTQFYFPLLLLIALLAACLPQRPAPTRELTATPESVSPQSVPTRPLSLIHITLPTIYSV